VIGSAACYAAGTVYARFLLRDGDPVTLTGLKLLIAALILAPVTLTVGGGTDFISLSPEGWASLVALGVGTAGLGRVLYLWVLRSAGSVRASMVTYITPVVGVVLGWAVMGEAIGLTVVAGGALVAFGVACVTYGRRLPLQRLARISVVVRRAAGTPAPASIRPEYRPQRPPA
jgi:drug/metabolite transporter (DMT)-like permease